MLTEKARFRFSFVSERLLVALYLLLKHFALSYDVLLLFISIVVQFP